MRKPILISGDNCDSIASIISRAMFEPSEIFKSKPLLVDYFLINHTDKKCIIVEGCTSSKQIVDLYLKLVDSNAKLVLIFTYSGKTIDLTNFSHIRLQLCKKIYSEMKLKKI